MRIAPTLPLVLLVAACGTQAPPPAAPAAPQAASSAALPADDTCGAARYAGMIGQPIGDAAIFRADGITFRVIYPGDAITEDFSAQRLNIRANDFGVIQSLECF